MDSNSLHNPEGVEVIIHPAPSRKQGGFILETMEHKFARLITNANTTVYLTVVAILCSSTKRDGWDIVKDFTRGDFKRAVKALRDAQASYPQRALEYEEAIAHIRREWLQREVTI